MVEIKNVIVVGASGSLGTPVLKAIIDSGKFNVTVLSREGSKATFPSSVKVVNADYSSVESLTAAFKGQDAVVSTVGTEGFLGQTLLVDAAIAAGVKRFIPSEFGSDIDNPKVAALPVFGYKVAVRKHLEAKVAAGADITYTYVISGPFLDWGLKVGFLLNWAEGETKIYDSGNQKFSATTLPDIGLAVVGVLTHYEETKNRSVHFANAQVSQNQLLAIAKKTLPQKTFKTVPVSTTELLKSSNEALAKGDYSVIVSYIFIGIFGEEYESAFAPEDNKLLGIKTYSEEELEKVISGVLTG